MLLSVIIILIVGGVAYFHYVQGFFSATLSAIIAVISAALAVSYQEPIVSGLLGGKFADQAPGMTLCILFAVIYLVIRTAVDSFVPGNLRLPVLADKLGAGAMGIVAGLMAGGIVAIAAQSLPFGSSVGMFSRFETNESRDVQLPTGGQAQDTFVYGELKDPDIEKNRAEDRHSLYVPADELVLATVQHLSNEGSMMGARPLASVHPHYLEELFLTNVGIQVGAKRTAMNTDKLKDVEVKGVFTLPSVPQAEGEMSVIRHRNLPATLTPKASEMILVVRTAFDPRATDQDRKFRFSTGSARLMAGGENYYPVGTLENGRFLYANALDDFLVCDSGKGADLVYVVPKADVLADSKAPPEKQKIADGVFVEIKRLGRVDLSEKKVTQGVKPSADVQVIRKPYVVKDAEKAGTKSGGGASSDQPAEGASAGPLQVQGVAVEGRIGHPIGTGTADKTVNNFQTASATGALADGKFTKLEVNGTESVQRMGAGSYAADELGAPAGQKVVQVHMIPQGDNAWAFESQVGAYRLKDEGGNEHQPNGVMAMVKSSDGGDHMVARYNATGTVADVPHTDGRPTDVWIYYVLPAGTHVTGVTFNGQNAGAADVTVQ